MHVFPEFKFDSSGIEEIVNKTLTQDGFPSFRKKFTIYDVVAYRFWFSDVIGEDRFENKANFLKAAVIFDKHVMQMSPLTWKIDDCSLEHRYR